MPHSLDLVFDVDEDGRLTDRRRARWMWEQLRFYAGGKVRIRISRPKRSNRANAYYWACIIEPIRKALMESGQVLTAEAIHSHFKAKYLPVRTVTVFDVDHVLPGTTTELDQTEFHDFIESIKNDEDVLNLGIYFEEPEEDYKSYAIAEPD